MLTVREKGRSLELIYGGGDDSLTFLVPPISSKAGATALGSWLELMFAVPLAENDEETRTELQAIAENTEALALAVLGQETYEAIQDLRADEQLQGFHAAFFWNVQGGGMEMVNLYLEGGLGKARSALLATAGLEQAHSLLRASLDSALANLTNAVASPGTTTPPGSGSSSMADETPTPVAP